MKKLLISIIGIIILIIIVVSAIKGIKIWKNGIHSVQEIKTAHEELQAKAEEAKTEKEQNYAKAVSDTEKSIAALKQAKEEYETKVNSMSGESGLGITQIEKYKIEYLWDKIGNYAKKEGLGIDINVEETTIQETYNIKFTINGTYVGITDFLYDIENDDELNYKVKNFKIEPSTSSVTSSSGQTTTSMDTMKLQANFTVENIIINFN